ncbi:MAG: hypothetical protein JWO38_4130 [Gemmataceae bacterium]|nr:hypothetical protein [Gemmataceae bacterium]
MGSQVEADVAEYRKDEDFDPGHGPNGTVAPLTTAPPAVLTLPAIFPDQVEVEVREKRAGRQLVGVTELVSPGNKDRAVERVSFVAKCVAYLRRGIGVVIVDVLTERHANLHNDLLAALGPASTPKMADAPTYAAGYRPVHHRASRANEIEVWPFPALIGQPIPAVPLGLGGGPTILLDLEGTYTNAIRGVGG